MLRLKPWSVSILSSSFCGQLAYYHSHIFSLIHPLDEFSFKEMRTWGQFKISTCCLCVQCKSRQLGGRGSPRFPTALDSRNLIFDTKSCRIKSLFVDLWPCCCQHNKVAPQRSEIIWGQGMVYVNFLLKATLVGQIGDLILFFLQFVVL